MATKQLIKSKRSKKWHVPVTSGVDITLCGLEFNVPERRLVQDFPDNTCKTCLHYTGS